jgi:hypothetical protein
MVVQTNGAGKRVPSIFRVRLTALPGRPCHVCGRRHQRWSAIGRCLWPTATWVSGNPPATRPCYALVSYRPHPAVSLHACLTEAEDAKREIDAGRCGSGCRDRHESILLHGGLTPEERGSR